ncbi:MAG: hypothetical protein Q8N56_01275 [bacterium]|nr:hypothetical protein [bacterium]
MKKLISKIKGIKCRIEQEKELKEESKAGATIFCYGNDDCNTCCGLKVCECSDKLIKRT